MPARPFRLRRPQMKFRASSVGVLLSLLMACGILVPNAFAGSTPVPASAGRSATTVAPLDQAVLFKNGVNELGVIPVLMYHTFTSDPANVTLWTRTFDGLRSQLQQLYDMGFYAISMRDLISNHISVPLGKHPIVLTFDDSSASQFLIDATSSGDITPRAQSAVGVLETFFASHRDFGHSAFFAVVPSYCFANAAIDEINAYSSCEAKLKWLVDRGYEIGNHTIDHVNLGTVGSQQFVEQVGGTVAWIDARVSGPANMSRVLVLPYGGRPAPGSNVDALMNAGFEYGGRTIQLDAVIDVSGGPMYSPSSTWWNPLKITRINSDPDTLSYWLNQFAGGNITLYTSDGNPDTVTIPYPLPEYLQNEFDAAAIKRSGKLLVQYEDPAATGTKGDAPSSAQMPGLKPGVQVATNEDRVNLRGGSSTNAPIACQLPEGTLLTILEGPVDRDGYTWWKVRTEGNAVGWIAEPYIAPLPKKPQ